MYRPNFPAIDCDNTVPNLSFMDKSENRFNQAADLVLTESDREKLVKAGLISFKGKSNSPRSETIEKRELKEDPPEPIEDDEIRLNAAIKLIGAHNANAFYSFANRRAIKSVRFGFYSRSEIIRKNKEQPYVPYSELKKARRARTHKLNGTKAGRPYKASDGTVSVKEGMDMLNLDHKQFYNFIMVRGVKAKSAGRYDPKELMRAEKENPYLRKPRSK